MHSAIEDDADFVQWSFSTHGDTDQTMTTLQQSSLSTKSHDLKAKSHDSKTIHLASLESIGKVTRLEPPFPSMKDHRGEIVCSVLCFHPNCILCEQGSQEQHLSFEWHFNSF